MSTVTGLIACPNCAKSIRADATVCRSCLYKPNQELIRDRIRAILDRIRSDLHIDQEKNVLDQFRAVLGQLGNTGNDGPEAKCRSMIMERLDADAASLTTMEKLHVVQGVLDELIGFGPLGPLLRDPAIGDICVNRFDNIYVEKDGRFEKTSVKFDNNRHLRETIDKLIQPMGYRLERTSPIVNAKLPNGSLVVATIPPVSIHGPTLTILCSRFSQMSLEQLVSKNALSKQMAECLEACVKGHSNIVISSAGTDGTERTTLLNALSEFFDEHERAIAIEKDSQIKLQNEHWVKLISCPKDSSGNGEVTPSMLINTALRMRPDRLVLEDFSVEDGLEFLNAIRSGLRGALCTVSASSSRDCLQRLQSMIMMRGDHVAPEESRELIASTLQLIVQMEKLEDGSRHVTEISEVIVLENGSIGLNTLFKMRIKGVGPDGFFLCDYVASEKK